VMFFPDKVQGYKEASRVLKAGGRFVFNVWDRISENEFADTVTEALAALFPHDPPRFMVRTPHGYHDVKRIREERAERSDFSDFHRRYYDHLESLGLTADEVVDIARALVEPSKN